METLNRAPELVKLVDKGFCGPTILSLLTGLPIKAVIEPAINKLRDSHTKRAVKGMYNREMFQLLGVFNLKHTSIDHIFARGVRLKKASMLADMYKAQVLLVNVTGHYIVLTGETVYDTFRPEGEHYLTHPSAGQLIRECWLIERVNKPKL